MLTSFWRGVRRFFGFDQVPLAPKAVKGAPSDADLEAAAASLAPEWWIPKDRKAKEAAQLAARRKALIEKLEEGKARQAAAGADTPATTTRTINVAAINEARAMAESAEDAEPEVVASADDDMIDVDLEQFATIDEVAAMLEDRRRARNEEERRIESVEIPQAMMMSDEEYALAKDWMLDHRTVHPLPKTEIYGQYWLHFARTSIGDTVSIGCVTCGRSKILTDHSQLGEPAAQEGSAG